MLDLLQCDVKQFTHRYEHFSEAYLKCIVQHKLRTEEIDGDIYTDAHEP